MATARELINGALRVLKVIASGETPTAAEAMDCLEALNQMLASWSASNLLIPYKVKEVLPAVSVSPTALATRPLRVDGAWVLVGSTDVPLTILSQAEYLGIPDKTATGQPTKLYHDLAFPASSLWLHPVPATAYQITLLRWDAITEAVTLDAEVELPRQYARAIKYNLAIEVADEFGMPVTDAMAARASEGMDLVKNLNSQPVPTLGTEFVSASFASLGGFYS